MRLKINHVAVCQYENITNQSGVSHNFTIVFNNIKYLLPHVFFLMSSFANLSLSIIYNLVHLL